MCLIIIRGVGEIISKEFFEDVWKRNNDGWGIMWVSGKAERRRARRRVGLDFNDFWNVFKNLQDANIPCLVHMRMKTKGEINTAMCHPYEVVPGLYMMHNGTISADAIGVPEKEWPEGASDSWAFANYIVKPILESSKLSIEETIRQPWFNRLISNTLSTNNRMVFMDRNGAEAMNTNNWGKTTDGLYVSNTYAFSMNNPNRTTYNSGTYHNSQSYYNSRYNGNAKYNDYSGRVGHYSGHTWKEGARPDTKEFQPAGSTKPAPMLPNSNSTTQGTSTTGNNGKKPTTSVAVVPMMNSTTPACMGVDLNQARDTRPGRAVATLVCPTGETSLRAGNGDNNAPSEFTGFRRTEEGNAGVQAAPVVTTVVESNAALARHEKEETFEKLSPDAIKHLVRGAARLKYERSQQRYNGEVQLSEEEAFDEARSLDERFRDQMFYNGPADADGPNYADDEDDEYLDALDLFYMQYVDCINADNDEARRLVEFEPQVASELLIYLAKEFE